MSESLRTEDPRQEALKRIIRRLHDGESVGNVKKDFDRLARGVSAEEIAAMEQALMNEGMKAEEIQRLCEVHVSVFESALRKERKPGKVPGHPVHTFMAENAAARASLSRLRAAARRLYLPGYGAGTAESVEGALADFKKLLVHYARKENQLFPFLEAAGFDAPSKVMWGKHDEVRAAFSAADAALGDGNRKALRRAIRALAGKTTRMFFMEERILFPAALRRLTEKDWVTMRRGEGAIGYAWVSPGGTWDPDIAEARSGAVSGTDAEPATADSSGFPAASDAPRAPEAPKSLQPGADGGQVGAATQPEDVPGALPMAEGWMTAEQVNLMLRSIPLDLSFVDENDRVIYYSDGPERIFPRSPAVIGRNVRNCHPPKSVATVQRILEAFKKKEKDSAEFWLQLGGRFLHVRYFPVYGEDGRYRGTVELSQDVTGIRELQGERKLLDWED